MRSNVLLRNGHDSGDLCLGKVGAAVDGVVEKCMYIGAKLRYGCLVGLCWDGVSATEGRSSVSAVGGAAAPVRR